MAALMGSSSIRALFIKESDNSPEHTATKMTNRETFLFMSISVISYTKLSYITYNLPHLDPKRGGLS
jgi:hypothetical protein